MFENPWEHLLTAEQEETHFQQIARRFQKDSETNNAELGVISTEEPPDDSKINIDSDDSSISDNEKSEELMEQETGSSPVGDLSQESRIHPSAADLEPDLCTPQGTESES